MVCPNATYKALALALCLALAGCTGSTGTATSKDAGTAGASQKKPTVVITNADSNESSSSIPTTVDSGKNAATASSDGTNGPKKKSDEANHDTLSTCLGSIAKKAADDHGNAYIELDTAREVFEFTIEGEKYELPCTISKFMETGKHWSFEQGYSFDDMRYDPGFSFDVGLWYDNDQNYNISVKLKNTSDEIAEWRDLTVVGVTVRPQDSYVSFESKAGVSRDSKLDELLDVLGCNDESELAENKTIVEYHVSLYDTPLYDMNASIYGNVSYDWNKTGFALTSLSFELLEPWDTILRKTDEEIREELDKRAEESETSIPSDVGRTVEGGV